MCENLIVSQDSPTEHKERRLINMVQDPEQQTFATTSTLSTCESITDLLSNLLEPKVEVRETDFTRQVQESLRQTLDTPTLEMRLACVPVEHSIEGYSTLEYSYIIFDGQTSEVLINSLEILDQTSYNMSDTDESYLISNGYDIKTLLGTVFKVFNRLSNHADILDNEQLLATS